MAEFPHEDEPDGDRLLGHHWWIGIGMMIIGFLQWAPNGTPTAGAALAALGLLVALDDYLSHAFGLWTPLDALFRWTVRRYREG